MAESRAGIKPGTPTTTATEGADGGGVPAEHDVIVDAVRDGMRLDMTVAALVPGVSRSAAQRLIELGEVRVDGRKRQIGRAHV